MSFEGNGSSCLLLPLLGTHLHLNILDFIIIRGRMTQLSLQCKKLEDKGGEEMENLGSKEP
jgi:hypothetical protein